MPQPQPAADLEIVDDGISSYTLQEFCKVERRGATRNFAAPLADRKRIGSAPRLAVRHDR
jgi:hypothetical protein